MVRVESRVEPAARTEPRVEPEPGFFARWPLIAVCVGLALAEAILLQGFGLRSGLALAPQVTAPPPIGVFHDLRWVFVYHSGYATFAALMGSLFVFRTALVTVLVRLAWPRNLEPPPWRKTALNAFGFVALSVIFLTPAATALFTAGVTTLWPFYVAGFVVGVPVLMLFWYLAFPGWWRRLPPWRPFAWIALEGGLLSIGALAIEASPAWVTIVPAALTGIFNALAWYAITDAVAHRVRGAQRQHEPVALRFATIGVVGSFAAAAIGFGVAIWVTTPEIPKPAPIASGQPLIDAHGFRSSFDGTSHNQFGSAFVYQRYSYRGLGPNGKPLPYAPKDTYATLADLANKLSVQVQTLYRRTGRKVDLLGDSEGTLVEKYYLLTHPGAPVKKLVMTSPIIRPARVEYPPGGADTWGIASRFALQREASFVGSITFPINVDIGLLRSLEGDAPLLRNGMLCPVEGVQQAAFLPMINAIGEPPQIGSHIPFTVLPTLHGSVGSARREAAWLSLTGGEIPHFTAWRIATDIARDAAAAWQVPSLPLSLGWAHPGARSACRTK